MARKTGKEAEEARERLREILLSCGVGSENRGTLVIDHIDGRPTATGRTDYLRLRVFGVLADNVGPKVRCTHDVTWLAARVFGYRYNEARNALSIGGCGYSKSWLLATDLARLCKFTLSVERANSTSRWMP